MSVDTKDRPTYKFGDAKKQQVQSKVTVRVRPGGEQNLNGQKVVQMERSDTGHLWFNLFDEMPTVSNDPYDLIDRGRPETMLATAPPLPLPAQKALVTEPATSAS